MRSFPGKTGFRVFRMLRMPVGQATRNCAWSLRGERLDTHYFAGRI
jgi:hypothetical protein